jgi:hypothetical protein
MNILIRLRRLSLHSIMRADPNMGTWPRRVQRCSQLEARRRASGLQEQHEQVYDQWQNE